MTFLIPAYIHTHTRHGIYGSSMTDLIFSKDESFISSLSVRPPLNGSDHCVLVFNYRISSYFKQSKLIYLYDKTNDYLVHDIYSNWQSSFTLDKSVNELWDNFKAMYQGILSCVPRRKFCLRKGSRYLHNPLFKELVKEKHRLWLVLSNTPSTSIWASYKHARNRVSRPGGLLMSILV